MEASVARQHYSPTKGEVLEPTEARQASPRKMNLRVLIFSTALIAVIFAGFIFAFSHKTPPQMDGTTQNSEQSRPATIPTAPGPSNPDTAK
jgi:hypothetical protein